MSDPTHSRDPELAALAQELAVHRALSRQAGDADEEPRLELASLRAHLPPPPPPWWRSIFAKPLALAAIAASIALAAVVFMPGENTTRLKSDRPACVDVRLEAGVYSGAKIDPLESKRVAPGTKLGLEAHLGAACFLSVYRVNVESKRVERIAKLSSPASGRVAIEGAPIAFYERGTQLLVALAEPEASEPDDRELLSLLAELAGGASCVRKGRACAIDVLSLEVE